MSLWQRILSVARSIREERALRRRRLELFLDSMDPGNAYLWRARFRRGLSESEAQYVAWQIRLLEQSVRPPAAKARGLGA
jgi:hypothetical protein